MQTRAALYLVARARGFYDLINAGQIEAASLILAEACIDYASPPELRTGRAAFQAAYHRLAVVLHQPLFDITDLFAAEDERVVAIMTVRGTQTGPFQGIPPTTPPRLIALPAIHVLRFRHHLIVERWEATHLAHLIQQVGAAIDVPIASDLSDSG